MRHAKQKERKAAVDEATAEHKSAMSSKSAAIERDARTGCESVKSAGTKPSTVEPTSTINLTDVMKARYATRTLGNPGQVVDRFAKRWHTGNFAEP